MYSSDDEDTKPKPIRWLDKIPIIIGDGLSSQLEDAKRYQWLKQQVTEVLCEGKATDCYSKYMLPRLTCEDSTGRRYTFDEIIDIQMKRELSND